MSLQTFYNSPRITSHNFTIQNYIIIKIKEKSIDWTKKYDIDLIYLGDELYKNNIITCLNFSRVCILPKSDVTFNP